MRVESGRRTFVRQVIVGAPALAGAAALSSSVQAAPLVLRPHGVQVDLAIESVLSRLAGLHNEMVRRRPTPEDVRTTVRHLQQLATLRQETTRDADLSIRLRGLVTHLGRERFLALQPDTRMLQAGLAYYGIDATHLRIGAVSYEARAIALDTLLDRGAASYYIDPGFTIDIATFVLAAASSACSMLDEMATLVEALAASLCLAAQFLPVLAPECFAATVVLAAIKIVELLTQC